MPAEPSGLEELDALRERIRALLSGRDMAELAATPPNGAWSVVENLRHLLFAEQAHIGHLLPTPPAFSALGLPPPGMMGNKRVGVAGTEPTTDAFKVLAEWDAAHAAVAPQLPTPDPKFEVRLGKHIKHLRLHLGIIERLLRQADKAKS